MGSFMDGRNKHSDRHCGDLLPIPAVCESLVVECLPYIGQHAKGLTKLVSFSLAGVNFLYGGFRAVSIPRRATHAQRSAQRRLVVKWWEIIKHASETGDYLDGLASPTFFRCMAGEAASLHLIASRVDSVAECGRVDPTPCLPTEMQDLLSSPCKLFPRGLHNVPNVVTNKASARGEYAKLVQNQLASRKVALMRRPTCSASTFVVSKSDACRLREVWDGSLISAASAEPFAPSWLADPSALVALESSWDSPLYLSTEYGACFFDQLRLPSSLVHFFGRPQFRVSELCPTFFSYAELRSFLIDDDGAELRAKDLLTPVGLTWPMSFAHSSYVAQEVVLFLADCQMFGAKSAPLNFSIFLAVLCFISLGFLCFPFHIASMI